MNLLITGAGRGLGLQLTREAAERGHTVWAGVRGPASAGKLKELQEKHGDAIRLLTLDVEDEGSIVQAAQELTHQAGVLDGIINNAAVLLGREQKLESLSLEELEQSFRVNLYGPIAVAKYIMPLLRKGEQQAIINISSEAGGFAGAYDGDYGYALSKSALNMFTAQLHKAFTPQGYAVYAVHPGWIRTDMGGASAPGDAGEAAKGILDLIERKVIPPEGAFFINADGSPRAL